VEDTGKRGSRLVSRGAQEVKLAAHHAREPPPTTFTNFVEASLGTRVNKTASIPSMGQREAQPIFFLNSGHGGSPIARSLASLSTSKVCTSSQRMQRQ
jgi:hypothetical protein